MATVKEVKSLPNRTFRKSSKYDTIIDRFIMSGVAIAEVTYPNTNFEYLSVQIKKRLRYYPGVVVNIRNGSVYLSRGPDDGVSGDTCEDPPRADPDVK